jgi:hypothetical protein
VRFHFYSVLLWRCQNLELENGGPRVVGPGILCRPFDAWDARRAARGHAPDAGCLRHQHPNATLFAVLLCLPTAPHLIMLLVFTPYPHSGRHLPRRVRAPARTQSAPPKPLNHARAAQRADTHRMRGAYGTRTQLYLECYCACRRHQDCHCRKRRFRYVAALFGQLSDKSLLACI